MPAAIPGPNQDQIPGPDADFEVFASNFAAVWNPAFYGAVGPDPAVMVSDAANFATALATASAPATRTPNSIAAKDGQRAGLTTDLRSAIRSAQTAYRAGDVTESSVLALGVRPADLTPSPILTPVDAPLIGVDELSVDQNVLRITQVIDGVAVSTRAFPYGVAGVELARSDAGGPFAIQGLRRRVILRESTVGLVQGSLIAWRARYVTSRGLAGPWSVPIGSVVFNSVL